MKKVLAVFVYYICYTGWCYLIQTASGTEFADPHWYNIWAVSAYLLGLVALLGVILTGIVSVINYLWD